MKANKVTETVSKIMDLGKKNSPAILCGTAIVGLFATVYCAYKAGPKAQKIIDKSKFKMEELDDIDYTPEDEKKAKRKIITDLVKDITPVMTPTAIMGGATIACMIGSQSINARRIALLSTAYSISETAVKELNGKMEEMLGDKKARSIKDAIMKDKLDKDKTPVSENQVILTGDGDVLCKDLYSGRYFRSNAQRIGQAINRLSHDIMTDMYVSLNDFYELIGIPEIPMGNDLGWNVDDCIRGQVPITLTALLTEEQTPCLCVEYDAKLRADYRNLH